VNGVSDCDITSLSLQPVVWWHLEAAYAGVDPEIFSPSTAVDATCLERDAPRLAGAPTKPP
jgi:hypothetical protein